MIFPRLLIDMNGSLNRLQPHENGHQCCMPERAIIRSQSRDQTRDLNDQSECICAAFCAGHCWNRRFRTDIRFCSSLKKLDWLGSLPWYWLWATVVSP